MRLMIVPSRVCVESRCPNDVVDYWMGFVPAKKLSVAARVSARWRTVIRRRVMRVLDLQEQDIRYMTLATSRMEMVITVGECDLCVIVM